MLEGVLVSAKEPGSTITVTVVSDASGDYAFSADRLDPGSYRLAIRAPGYALEGAGSVELSAGRAATADLKLKAAAVIDQLTNAEWLVSAPGPQELKRGLLNCTDCHSLHRFSPRHIAPKLLEVFDRMGAYYPGASDMQPQRLNGNHRRPAVNPATGGQLCRVSRRAQSQRSPAHRFELTITSRPTGRATRVIITEYDRRGKKSSRTT